MPQDRDSYLLSRIPLSIVEAFGADVAFDSIGTSTCGVAELRRRLKGSGLVVVSLRHSGSIGKRPKHHGSNASEQ